MDRRGLTLLLALLVAAPALGQSLAWERVGTTPHSFYHPSFGADGYLYAAGDPDLRRLPPPYDSTQVWTSVSNRYAIVPVLALGLDTLIVTARSDRMARSTDGGATFTEMTGLRPQGAPVEIPPGVPFGGSVVVPGRADAAGDRYGAYSRDRGATWQPAAITGLDPKTFPRSGDLAVVTSGPHAGRVVSAGMWGLAVSDDGGAVYRPVAGRWGHFRMEATAIGVLRGAAPGGGDRLVAVHDDIQDATPGAPALVSDDGGDTWRATTYLTGDPNEYGAAVVDFGSGTGVIAMDGGHVWATADGGESWRIVGVVPGALVDSAPSPLPYRGRVQWALRGPDGRLYVGGIVLGGSNPGWMFRTASPFVVAGAGSPEVAPGVSLSVRPIPTGGTVWVVVEAPAPGDAVVVVLDALGRAVARVHAGPVAAGATPFALDTSGFAAGVYVVRATVGGTTTTARLVVTR